MISATASRRGAPPDTPGRTVGAAPPLCVDLDGTLIAGDLLWEGLLAMLKQRPWLALWLPFWLMRGRAHVKRRIAERTRVDASTLPYRAEVLALLQRAHAEGRELALATASDQGQAEAVAAHVGVFSAVLASDGTENLSGTRKAAALSRRYGAHGFDYVGNDWPDIPIWRAARRAILVSPPRALLRKVSAMTDVAAVIAPRTSKWVPAIRAARPYQWVKNLLLFVPLITSHRLLDPALVASAVVAFAAFCLCASSIYVVNDLLDIQSDRLHARKRRRPFASGELSVLDGLVLGGVLLTGGLLLGWFGVSPAFGAVLAVYCVASTAYSLRLKREAVADVFMLAGLYMLRIFAGGIATGIVVSTWLFAFAMFFFLSLAFVKRYAELASSQESIPGRGYAPKDVTWMHAIGVCSGYISVLILALYITSPDVTDLYRDPRTLWLLCPLLLYWITLIWFRASRREMLDDPVLAALKDPTSYLVGLAAAVILIVAL